jgi:hypothetical protein
LIAYPAAGFISALLGIQTAFILIGIVAAIVTIISWKIYTIPDETVLEHTHKKMKRIHYHSRDRHHVQIEIPDINLENHQHTHQPITNKHKFVIDRHHCKWP